MGKPLIHPNRFLFAVLLLLSFTIAFALTPQTLATPGLYWFQVGAWGANGGAYGSNFGMPVTGASEEIRVNYRHSYAAPNGEVVYWVGINLPGDSFIQVGYMIQASN